MVTSINVFVLLVAFFAGVVQAEVSTAYNGADTIEKCGQMFLSRTNQNTDVTCQEKTNMARCVARIDRYLNRPLTADDTASFDARLKPVLGTAKDGCPLDIVTVKRDLFSEVTSTAVMITQIGDVAPDAMVMSNQPVILCVTVFASLLNGTVTRGDIIALIACVACAIVDDLRMLTAAVLQHRQTALHLLFKLLGLYCSVDLKVIINSCPTTASTLTTTIATEMTTTVDTTTTTPTTTTTENTTTTPTTTTTETTTTTPTTTTTETTTPTTTTTETTTPTTTTTETTTPTTTTTEITTTTPTTTTTEITTTTPTTTTTETTPTTTTTETTTTTPTTATTETTVTTPTTATTESTTTTPTTTTTETTTTTPTTTTTETTTTTSTTTTTETTTTTPTTITTETTTTTPTTTTTETITTTPTTTATESTTTTPIMTTEGTTTTTPTTTGSTTKLKPTTTKKKYPYPVIENKENAAPKSDKASVNSSPYQGCLNYSSIYCGERPDGIYSTCYPECASGFYIICIYGMATQRQCPEGSSRKRMVFDSRNRYCQEESESCRRPPPEPVVSKDDFTAPKGPLGRLSQTLAALVKFEGRSKDSGGRPLPRVFGNSKYK